MRPKDKCPFDIELHREIWLNGYEKAIHAAIKWLGKNAYRYVSTQEYNGVMVSGLRTPDLLYDIENALINGKEVVRIFDGKEIRTKTREYEEND